MKNRTATPTTNRRSVGLRRAKNAFISVVLEVQLKAPGYQRGSRHNRSPWNVTRVRVEQQLAVVFPFAQIIKEIGDGGHLFGGRRSAEAEGSAVIKIQRLEREAGGHIFRHGFPTIERGEFQSLALLQDPEHGLELNRVGVSLADPGRLSCDTAGQVAEDGEGNKI